MINKTYPITEKLLKNGLDSSLHLIDLLTKEAENLKQKTDPITLSNIAANKKETVAQLNQFSKQLSQVLSTENLQLTPEGVFEYLKRAAKKELDTTNCIRYWNEIHSLAKQCQLLNEENGASINILMQYAHRSLNILKGKSQQPTTYGSDGSTQRDLFTHSLVSV